MDETTEKKVIRLSRLFALLELEGFKVVRVNDGGDDDERPRTIAETVELILSTSEVEVWVLRKGALRSNWIQFTPFNDGAEMVCDYTIAPIETAEPFEKVLNAWTEEIMKEDEA